MQQSKNTRCVAVCLPVSVTFVVRERKDRNGKLFLTMQDSTGLDLIKPVEWSLNLIVAEF